MTLTNAQRSGFVFAIDRGGTFTDIFCELPNGKQIVLKLLSEDPNNYDDAPREGIRRILCEFGSQFYPEDAEMYQQTKRICGVQNDSNIDAPKNLVPTKHIKSITMGTTVATNALLERQGARCALLISKGFRDLLRINTQSRANIFDIEIARLKSIYEEVVEIDERVILSKFCPEASQYKDEEIYATASNTTTDEPVIIVKPLNSSSTRNELLRLQKLGITSIAITFMHSYTFRDHEIEAGQLAKEVGFPEVSLSHAVSPMTKIVPRGHTALASAYLSPIINAYILSFLSGFTSFETSSTRLSFMKSDGGLANVSSFSGHQAILSGPAGGVIGYAKTTYNGKNPVIGFDMGGTSTDVSRFDGSLELLYNSVIADTYMQAPQLDISTVAAGGGSRLFLSNGLFIVGPESAGSDPGPVSYRKNGFLTVTDANLVLGRIVPDYFPHIFGPNEDQGLDYDTAYKKFEDLRNRCPEGMKFSVPGLAQGFIKVANEAMCRPIRNLTTMKGHDLSLHTLSAFGGAGPQHACAIALNLGMEKVFVHKYGGVLSAFGLSMADAVTEEQEAAANIFATFSSSTDEYLINLGLGDEKFQYLERRALKSLVSQDYNEESVVIERFVNLRFEGTDTPMMTSFSEDTVESFLDNYRREFGFLLKRDILLDDYRVRGVVPGKTVLPYEENENYNVFVPKPERTHKMFIESVGDFQNVPVYLLDNLSHEHIIHGPSIIIQNISTIIIEENCTATISIGGNIVIKVNTELDHKKLRTNDTQECDPIKLSVFAHRFMGIAECMGRTLVRTSISVNIKERLDFSCAIFDANGGLVANAPHIPVHLGAMQSAVEFQISYWNSNGREGINEGDVLVSNHPQLAGGSHLPDITVITPVYLDNKIVFYIASRGHHADIGGIAPGSMPPHSTKLEDEGAAIVAFKLVRHNQFQEEGITEILMSAGEIPGSSPCRNLPDVLSDLKAQVAANRSGIYNLLALIKECGLDEVSRYMGFIQDNAEYCIRSTLKAFSRALSTPTLTATEGMDDGSVLNLNISINNETGSAVFDFTGTSEQVLMNHNAPPAVTYSATIYCLRCLMDHLPPGSGVGRAVIPCLNQGCLAPIEFVLPEGSILHPTVDAAVVGGNVLTSQRLVDLIFKAFQVCAASNGCMNNFTFGDESFGYYETIGGGAGAGPHWHGQSGVHTHCTNTRITDPEILERRYPVILREFSLRQNSGGPGTFIGGEGIIRTVEPLRPLTMSLLTERRVLRPYGMAGGKDGKPGKNMAFMRSSNNGIYHWVNVGGRCSLLLQAGDLLRIETPGGGGYGNEDTIEESDCQEIHSNPFVGYVKGGSLAQYDGNQRTA